MRKKLLLATLPVIASFVIAGAAFANSPSGKGHNPFDALWKAVHQLQQQISLIPAGPPGPPGIQGPAGPAIDKAMTYVATSSVDVAAGASATQRTECADSNDVLINGGFSAAAGLAITSSMPDLSLTNQAWSVSATNNGATTGTLTVQADCLNVP